MAGAVAVPLAPNSNRAEDQGPFVASLSNVLSSPSSSLFLSNVPSISSYLKGIRIGKGAAIAVVRPKNMEELVKLVFFLIIIMIILVNYYDYYHFSFLNYHHIINILIIII